MQRLSVRVSGRSECSFRLVIGSLKRISRPSSAANVSEMCIRDSNNINDIVDYIINRFERGGKNDLTMLKLQKLLSVSYTHLDVYKRQNSAHTSE